MTESDFELPQISAEAAPEFSDVLSCKAWLEHVPLANVAEAQRQLLAQIEEFNRFPCKAAMRLQVLEALREAVAFVQIEQAKRFTNRALPMAEAEGAIFAETTRALGADAHRLSALPGRKRCRRDRHARACRAALAKGACLLRAEDVPPLPCLSRSVRRRLAIAAHDL